MGENAGSSRQAVEEFGGASRARTDGLVVANEALSQLSYSPTEENAGWSFYFSSVRGLAPSGGVPWEQREVRLLIFLCDLRGAFAGFAVKSFSPQRPQRNSAKFAKNDLHHETAPLPHLWQQLLLKPRRPLCTKGCEFQKPLDEIC